MPPRCCHYCWRYSPLFVCDCGCTHLQPCIVLPCGRTHLHSCILIRPLIIVGLGTFNYGSLHFDSGLFVSWFWHSWFSYFPVQLHFCTFSVIVSPAPHFHQIVRFRTLRQNRERYNPPYYDKCPIPHAGLGTECTHTGFRQLSGILWRTNLEICNFTVFTLVVLVIGHFPSHQKAWNFHAWISNCIF